MKRFTELSINENLTPFESFLFEDVLDESEYITEGFFDKISALFKNKASELKDKMTPEVWKKISKQVAKDPKVMIKDFGSKLEKANLSVESSKVDINKADLKDDEKIDILLTSSTIISSLSEQIKGGQVDKDIVIAYNKIVKFINTVNEAGNWKDAISQVETVQQKAGVKSAFEIANDKGSSENSEGGSSDTKLPVKPEDVGAAVKKAGEAIGTNLDVDSIVTMLKNLFVKNESFELTDDECAILEELISEKATATAKSTGAESNMKVSTQDSHSTKTASKPKDTNRTKIKNLLGKDEERLKLWATLLACIKAIRSKYTEKKPSAQRIGDVIQLLTQNKEVAKYL